MAIVSKNLFITPEWISIQIAFWCEFYRGDLRTAIAPPAGCESWTVDELTTWFRVRIREALGVDARVDCF